jgi:hypothetical protein
MQGLAAQARHLPSVEGDDSDAGFITGGFETQNVHECVDLERGLLHDFPCFANPDLNRRQDNAKGAE